MARDGIPARPGGHDAFCQGLNRRTLPDVATDIRIRLYEETAVVTCLCDRPRHLQRPELQSRKRTRSF